MFKEIRDDLDSDRTYYRSKRKYYKDHKLQIAEVAQELNLPEDAVLNATCSTDEINLRISGGPNTMKEIFRTFRKLGYKPTSRPGIKPEATFSCYFRREEDEGCNFYFYFTSLICRRVKIGTKTVEQDIYETICE